MKRGAESIRFALAHCWLGLVLAASSARGLCAVLLGNDGDELIADLHLRFPRTRCAVDDPMRPLAEKVAAFTEAPAAPFDFPLNPKSTPFQARVWQALCDIPPGQTASYTEIARRIDAPHSVRAVAGACAANPLAVVIPCHRAVRSDGSLAGYSWGIERKRALLERESLLCSLSTAANPTTPAVPNRG